MTTDRYATVATLDYGRPPGKPHRLSTSSTHNGWQVGVEWGPMGGRIEPADICIVSTVNRATTADAIRKLPIGEMLAEGRRAIANLQSQLSPMILRSAADNPDLAASMPRGLIVDVEVGKPQRGQRLTVDDLEAVAEVYRAAWSRDEPVNEAVRRAFHLSRDGAAKRIMRARAAGLLDGIGPKR